MVLQVLRALLRDEDGVSAVEYGVLAAFVSIACIVSLRAIGNAEISLYQSILSAIFNSTSDTLNNS